MFRMLLSKFAGVAGYVIQYAALTHCAFEYIGDFVICSGPSMLPTLEPENILLTDRISPRLKKLERGDIIIAKSVTNPKQYVCKRIVGIPGDTIILSRPNQILNDSSDEQLDTNLPLNRIVVSRGHVWIEGDNRENSSDSRSYGQVPLGLVRSKAVCRIWPIKDFKWLN